MKNEAERRSGGMKRKVESFSSRMKERIEGPGGKIAFSSCSIDDTVLFLLSRFSVGERRNFFFVPRNSLSDFSPPFLLSSSRRIRVRVEKFLLGH